MANVDQEYINKMYDSSLESQKQSLQQDYEQSISNLEAEQKKAQQQTDANLNRAYVEAAKAAKNYNEVQNAYGLSSGAMAQARLAQDNQLQGNVTAIRTAQQETDAEAERQRSLLAKEYASAISQAQADNDLARAQALYEQAKAAEAQLLQQQKEAASMLGAAGDFSMHGTAYGMNADQVAALQAAYEQEIAKQTAAEEQEKQLAAAELMASVGDYSLLAQMYGLTDEQAALLQGDSTGGSSGGNGNNGGYTSGAYPATEETGAETTITNYSDESGVQVGDQKLSWIELAVMVDNGRIVEKVNPQTGKVTYSPSSTYSGVPKSNNQKTNTGASSLNAIGKESNEFLRG